MPYAKIGGMAQVTLAENIECDCPWVILTMDNALVFLGDFTVTTATSGTTLLCTLPEGYRPKNDMYVQCVVKENKTSLTLYTTSVALSSDGQLKTTVATMAKGDSYQFHNKEISIMDKFYNPDIGNLTTSKTSDW